MANKHELLASVTNELLANVLWTIMSSWSGLNYIKHDNGLLQEYWQYELVWPVRIITQTILIAFEYQRYLTTESISQILLCVERGEQIPMHFIPIDLLLCMR